MQCKIMLFKSNLMKEHKNMTELAQSYYTNEWCAILLLQLLKLRRCNFCM